MKTFTATHSHNSKKVPVIEHTPIYDLAAYQQQQQQLKRKKLLKNLSETVIFLGMAGLTLSTLFLGG